METGRFVPMKRTALDGKVWRCIYDTQMHCWSPFLCHGKYKTKKAALLQLEFLKKFKANVI